MITTFETPYKQRLLEGYSSFVSDKRNVQSVDTTSENPYKQRVFEGFKYIVFQNLGVSLQMFICSLISRNQCSKTPINKGFSEIRNNAISKAEIFIGFSEMKFWTGFQSLKKCIDLKTRNFYQDFKTEIFDVIFKLKKQTLIIVNVYRGFVSSKVDYFKSKTLEFKCSSVNAPFETSMNTGCFRGLFLRVLKGRRLMCKELEVITNRERTPRSDLLSSGSELPEPSSVLKKELT